MSQGILFLLALSPVAIVFLLLVVMHLSASLAMAVAYNATVQVALFVWNVDADTVLAATVKGVVTALTVLFIVFAPFSCFIRCRKAAPSGRSEKGFPTSRRTGAARSSSSPGSSVP